MPINEATDRATHYQKVASEYRAKAAKPEYGRVKRELLDVATEWARLADTVTERAEATAAPATPPPSYTAHAS